MQLRKLKIERSWYGKNEGQYVGEIEFDNELGQVALKLTHERCEELFSICADGIVETAKKAAEEMTCAIIEHQSVLENTKS